MDESHESVIEALHASQRRLQLIADHVGDVIWTAEFPASAVAAEPSEANAPAIADAVLEHWRFSFDHLPDFVFIVDRNANIHFASRSLQKVAGDSLQGVCGLEFIAPEHCELGRDAVQRAFETGLSQSKEVRDIFGRWWSVRLVPMSGKNGVERLMVIATDVTQERLAVEATKKEQRLLRQLLELHERQRQLIAYEIHDGFAQQLTGALFHLQGFRETFARSPDEAWKGFDVAARLVCQAIDETRRLISGLRPPVLDESGIVEAVHYLICEQRKDGGPEIEFDHDSPCQRLAPPLESAIFRIIQESLQNACRHSRSDRIHVALRNRDGRIHIDVRDWGVGFHVDEVAQRRFGLQGIRERAGCWTAA